MFDCIKESAVDDEGANPGTGSWKAQLHVAWDVVFDRLLPPSGSEHVPQGSFSEFFRIVVDGKRIYRFVDCSVSYTEQRPCSPLRLPPRENTGGFKYSKKLWHASGLPNSQCSLPKTSRGLGSITFQTRTVIYTKSHSMSYVASITGSFMGQGR